MESTEHGPDGAARVSERIDHIGSTAKSLYAEVRETAEDVVRGIDLQRRVREHPYGMVLAACGLGYVLGGGLFTSLTGRLLRLGIKAAAVPMIQDELASLAEAAISKEPQPITPNQPSA